MLATRLRPVRAASRAHSNEDIFGAIERREGARYAFAIDAVTGDARHPVDVAAELVHGWIGKELAHGRLGRRTDGAVSTRGELPQ